MSTADEPMARICSRQICRRPAEATLTYVYADSTAVIGPLSVHAEPHAYDLCSPHASRLTPPRGWEIMRLETAPPRDDGFRSTSLTGHDPAALAQDGDPGPGAGTGDAGHPRRLGLADLSAEPHAAGPASSQSGGRRGAAPISPVFTGIDAGADAGADVGDDAPQAPRHPVGEHALGERTGDEQPVQGRPVEARRGPGAPVGRTRSGRRLSAVPSAAPAASVDRTADGSAGEPTHGRPRAQEPVRQNREGTVADGSPSAAGPERDDGPATLTDEIFAGEGTDVVDSRRRLAAQPEGMRRPHLRRGRRPRTGA